MSTGKPSFIYTSESVTEGHPDKVCDFVADSILDAHLKDDPQSRVACEVLCKGSHVVLAGEITSSAKVDCEGVARLAIARVGYVDENESFAARTVTITNLISSQSGEISRAVGGAGETPGQLGAGDQGMMMGYATNETLELMPLPILLAHRLSNTLACDRKDGLVPWLKPDGKTQVTVAYRNGTPDRVTRVVVSTQHSADARAQVEPYVKEHLVPRALGDWFTKDIVIAANPSGSFTHGGPSADCGVTGRKIIVDTYGGLARHGGGAFSGKDPTKVDRSGAYFCRYVARSVVTAGLAQRAEVSVAYAIGLADPMHVSVNTFGTGDDQAAERFVRDFDFRPAAIIERLDLRRPIYARTTNYGHFGRPGFPWEGND